MWYRPDDGPSGAVLVCQQAPVAVHGGHTVVPSGWIRIGDPGALSSVGGIVSLEHTAESTKRGDSFWLGMPLQLPAGVEIAIADQFRTTTRRALRHYSGHRADEDSLAGSLGTMLVEHVNGVRDGYSWETTFKKFRGRGPGADEHRYGADFAYEIEADVYGRRRRKTLLVQAKREWSGFDARLPRQADLLSQLPDDAGMIVDLRPDGYRAVSASIAAAAGGDARNIPNNAFRELGDSLAEFAACRIGSTRIAWDEVGARVLVLNRSLEEWLPVDVVASTVITKDGAVPE